MNKLLQHKADFKHKLAIKIYIFSFTLLLVNLFPEVLNVVVNTHWGWYVIILGFSYFYCLKKVISP